MLLDIDADDQAHVLNGSMSKPPCTKAKSSEPSVATGFAQGAAGHLAVERHPCENGHSFGVPRGNGDRRGLDLDHQAHDGRTWSHPRP